MLKGLPYTDSVDLYTLSEDIYEDEKNSSLYELICLVLEEHKNYVVFIDDYPTWLDDICFDYRQSYLDY